MRSKSPYSHYTAGQEVFKGVKLHSGVYRSPAEWKGKHGIVVGTANTGKKGPAEWIPRLTCSAHDVAVDMVKAGLASVTMVQRSKTCMEIYFELFNFASANGYGKWLSLSSTICPYIRVCTFAESTL